MKYSIKHLMSLKKKREFGFGDEFFYTFLSTSKDHSERKIPPTFWFYYEQLDIFGNSKL